jgi:hypothetical protein
MPHLAEKNPAQSKTIWHCQAGHSPNFGAKSSTWHSLLANLEHGEPLVLTADLASYCHHPGGDREICRDFLPFIFPHFLTSPHL